MKNIKAHLNIPGLIVKTVLIGSAVVITYMLATGKTVPNNAIAAFAAIIFFAQFLNMMFGMNPIGMISGMFIALFALIMLKAVYSFPDSFVGQFFITNAIYIAPTIVAIDIIRDMID